MTYNLGELYERVADVIPERMALITPERRLTYRALDERANQLAHRLRELGVRSGDHLGLQLLNGTEFVEGMLAAFKLSAVPVNVNYRYVERELEYLFDNADLTTVMFHRQFGAVVGPAARAVGSVEHLVVVDDGSGADVPADAVDYETAIESAPTSRDWSGRSDDDLYIAYTGGTTGLPKGVMWRHEDVFFAALGGGDPLLDKGPITDPDLLGSRVPRAPDDPAVRATPHARERQLGRLQRPLRRLHRRPRLPRRLRPGGDLDARAGAPGQHDHRGGRRHDAAVARPLRGPWGDRRVLVVRARRPGARCWHRPPSSRQPRCSRT